MGSIHAKSDGPPTRVAEVAQGRRAGAASRAATAVRASDSERATVADSLRRHAGAGRLDMEELDERVERALEARTRADLQLLLADLPTMGTPTVSPAPNDGGNAWRSYLAVMVLLVGIWLFTGAGHPWPLYPALGWGIPLLVAGRPTAGCGRRVMNAG